MTYRVKLIIPASLVKKHETSFSRSYHEQHASPTTVCDSPKRIVASFHDSRYNSVVNLTADFDDTDNLIRSWRCKNAKCETSAVNIS